MTEKLNIRLGRPQQLFSLPSGVSTTDVEEARSRLKSHMLKSSSDFEAGLRNALSAGHPLLSAGEHGISEAQGDSYACTNFPVFW